MGVRSSFFVLCLVAIFVNDTLAQTATKDPAKAPTDKIADPINITIHKETYSPEEPMPNSEEPPSTATDSSARRAATKPIRMRDEGFRIRPSGGTTSSSIARCHRMKDFSLAQQVEYFTIQDPSQQSSFEALLKLEDERQQQMLLQNSRTAEPSPFFLSMLGSAVLFAISSFVWDPASAKSLWKTVVNKKMKNVIAVGWLPWVWARPSKLAVFDLLVIVQFIRQPAMLPYLQYEIIPIIGKTLHTMVVTEIWARIWKWFFPHWDQLVKFVARQSSALWKRNDNSSKGSAKEKSASSSGEEWKVGHICWPEDVLGKLPPWMVATHKFLVGGVRKGIKSAFKKSAQETMVSSFSVWKEALQEQVIVRVVEAQEEIIQSAAEA